MWIVLVLVVVLAGAILWPFIIAGQSRVVAPVMFDAAERLDLEFRNEMFGGPVVRGLRGTVSVEILPGAASNHGPSLSVMILLREVGGVGEESNEECWVLGDDGAERLVVAVTTGLRRFERARAVPGGPFRVAAQLVEPPSSAGDEATRSDAEAEVSERHSSDAR